MECQNVLNKIIRYVATEETNEFVTGGTADICDKRYSGSSSPQFPISMLNSSKLSRFTNVRLVSPPGGGHTNLVKMSSLLFSSIWERLSISREKGHREVRSGGSCGVGGDCFIA